MYENPRQFVDALGGYRAVARRIGIGSTTLHGYMSEGVFPPRWYSAFLALTAEAGIEPPSRALFSFEVLPPLTDLDEAAA